MSLGQYSFANMFVSPFDLKGLRDFLDYWAFDQGIYERAFKNCCYHYSEFVYTYPLTFIIL